MDYALFAPIKPACPEPRGISTRAHQATLLREPIGHEYAAADAVRNLQRRRRVLEAHSSLRELFLRALINSDAASTPVVPTVFSLNVATDGERDRLEPRLRMEPVTVVAGRFSELQGFVDRTLAVCRAQLIGHGLADAAMALNTELADAYADAYAQDLVAIGWSAEQ